MIFLQQLSCVLAVVTLLQALEFPGNPSSDASADEHIKDRTRNEHSDQDDSGVEDYEGATDKQFLDAALKTVLDPNSVILKTNEEIERDMQQFQTLPKNTTLEHFMEEMDNLSLEICKTSQGALWSYVSDANNEGKKANVIRVAAEDDEVKKLYWTILKTHYLTNTEQLNDPKLRRKLKIIKENGMTIQEPKSHSKWIIDSMQKVWSEATVCAYNAPSCEPESAKTMTDIKRIFQTSNDTEELAYYWKAYRDSTGKVIRPLFDDHILIMNLIAKSENFSDAGEMWRFPFDDDDFIQTVDRLWTEIKPLYDVIRDYVRNKLRSHFKDDLAAKDSLPAHLLGNIWAQEWQAVYPKVVIHPDSPRPEANENSNMSAKELFDIVDEFHKSLGFESSNDSYQDVGDNTAATCMPSSHDMCDGTNYKINWCGRNITDATASLTKASRLLSHVQYFKHYKDLEPVFRDGPNPAFHDAISDIIAIQVTSPGHLQTLDTFRVDNDTDKANVNNLLWLSLDKLPLMGYAYVLDRWRWDVFANRSTEKMNQHWWELRTKETGISPPAPRDERDLDPASKYHVVSDIQYISFLISNVLEFQILKALCENINHTGPLHTCSLHGSKEAGNLLSRGMSLGASADWRTVLQTMTGDTEISTQGFLEYFSPLEEILRAENMRLNNEDMDSRTPIIVGCVVALLTILILILYCVKKHNVGGSVLSLCGLSKNGSLDIVTSERQKHEMKRIKDAKA